ncbi:MAG: hypothetical protein AAF220_04895 [Pseudomonadota bacterium]
MQVKRKVFLPLDQQKQKIDMQAVKTDADKYLTSAVMRMVETHGCDTETALLAIMAQCTKQVMNRSGKLHKHELVTNLNKTHLGKKIPRRH